MDRKDGDDLTSESDPTHESSFITATEGRDSDIDGADARYMDEPGDNEGVNLEHSSVPSSRSMPVPDYMEKRQKFGSSRDNVDAGASIEVPPPCYEDAVRDTGAEAETNVPEEPVPLATEEEAELSPAEIAIVMKHQEDRSSYIPPDVGRRGSMQEAVEMLPKPEQEAPIAESRSAATYAFDGNSRFNIEEGRPQQQREEYTCTSLPFGNDQMTGLCRMLRRQSSTRLLLFTCLVILVLGLLLFVSLFPASFVYLDYHQIALKQSKMTNVVDRDHVYYGGCYVLGPDTQFVRFQASSHDYSREMSVFTSDTIALTIRFSVHYFLRPNQVGKLYSKFYLDYEDVFELLIRSSIRNLGGSSLTVDNFRFNRTYVENQMHNVLRRRLGGDCCPDCCQTRNCQNMNYCEQCNHGNNCDQGYHVDVRYFNLLSVTIPSEVFERYLRNVILQVNQEKEFFIQDYKVTVKKTLQETQYIKNEANEITNAGQSSARTIQIVAAADRESVVQKSFAGAYKELYSQLNITDEELKLSLMYVQAMKKQEGNLKLGYGFEKNSLYAKP